MPTSRLRRSSQTISESSWNTLFSNLFPRARNRARQHLATCPLPSADEDDVAQSALKKLCLRLMNAELDCPDNPDQLWNLLQIMVQQKLVDYRRRERTLKRGGGQTYGDSALTGTDHLLTGGIRQVSDGAPSAAELAMVEEQKQRLLSELDDPTLRQIAIWKMEDRSNPEIAKLLGICVRTVERKLWIIRRTWWSENV